MEINVTLSPTTDHIAAGAVTTDRLYPETSEQVEIPQRGEFVPCDSCQQRSYFFYRLGDASILSYCYHHGNKYEENLKKVASLVADYSGDLKENRLQGAPRHKRCAIVGTMSEKSAIAKRGTANQVSHALRHA